MNIIENKTFDEERALYGSDGLTVRNCSFDGPADGESAFKESRSIRVEDSFFNLRYPFWHDTSLELSRVEMTELCRAALWYTEDVTITDSRLHGIKALRECARARLSGCDIVSPEFGWSVRGVEMTDCTAQSEYFMMRSTGLTFRDVRFKGKYSFQYIENGLFEDCVFDTKDAFWHAKNVTVRNSVLKGEYLAWYSENLTLDHCKIIGTQPLCYCKGLTLIDCEMADTDLAFERSEVEATITTRVDSIKNPRSGLICVVDAGEIIMDDPLAKGEIVCCQKPVAADC